MRSQNTQNGSQTQSQENHSENSRFGKLTILKVYKPGIGKSVADCVCDCGTLKTIRFDHIKAGSIVSCGCVMRQTRKTHGLSNEHLYMVYRTMVGRCRKENTHTKKWYADKGICVCDEWSDVEVFVKFALENGWKPGLEIDRINTAGNYEPNNVRFVTHRENANNTTRNRLLTINGQQITLAYASRLPNAKHRVVISKRLAKGASDYDAVFGRRVCKKT